jgi:hypothetical protein
MLSCPGNLLVHKAALPQERQKARLDPTYDVFDACGTRRDVRYLLSLNKNR